MTSNKNSAKAVDATEVAEAEASVPQQNTGEKVTILKGQGENGKDAIIISEADTEEKAGVVDKFKSLIRNKKVLAGLGTVAAIAIFAIVKGMANSVEEDDVTITTETDEAGNVTSVTITNNDTTD